MLKTWRPPSEAIAAFGSGYRFGAGYRHQSRNLGPEHEKSA
ncbi:hypothetical protein C4K25_0372 [Pseudomonas chlororaphis]|nr:hypothetical protein C4K25_0372 [Pseudomonas chlororaphis]